MNRIVELPKDLPASWPTHWTGSTRIDCGAQGNRLLTLYVGSHPNATHVTNFRSIVGRWQEIWPRIYEMLTTTFECPAIQSPGDVLEMTLPNTPIERGAEWYVNVRLYNDTGAWTVWFKGWEVNLGSSGYGYNG